MYWYLFAAAAVLAVGIVWNSLGMKPHEAAADEPAETEGDGADASADEDIENDIGEDNAEDSVTDTAVGN